MQGTSLPEDTRNNFLNVFRQLPNYHIIWKWESDAYFPGQADNVQFKKWIPQQDLLGELFTYISEILLAELKFVCLKT